MESETRAEVSFLVSDSINQERTLYHKVFSEFISLIKEIAFIDLSLNRLFTETYNIRPFHISILEKNDFQLEGRMRSHIIINKKRVDSLIHSFLKENYEK